MKKSIYFPLLALVCVCVYVCAPPFDASKLAPRLCKLLEKRTHVSSDEQERKFVRVFYYAVVDGT